MKFTKWISVLALVTAAPTVCLANGLMISAGKAPDAEGGGTSVSITTKSSPNLMWGLGLVLNSEFSNKDLLDYPVPHNSYTNLGMKRTGNSIGLDVNYLFSDDGATVRPYVGVGLYNSPKKEIAQSNVTGWYYTQNDRGGISVGAEIGVLLSSERGLTIGVGFHTIRGANISIGSMF